MVLMATRRIQNKIDRFNLLVCCSLVNRQIFPDEAMFFKLSGAINRTTIIGWVIERETQIGYRLPAPVPEIAKSSHQFRCLKIPWQH